MQKDSYSTIDGDDVSELMVYKDKNYYFDRDLDARRKNSIDFMRFDKGPKDYEKFKKTQLYHYQNITTKLEFFLSECDINYKSLHFQTDHYIENSFVKNIESLESLEIINNTGVDFTALDLQFLQNFLKHQGISLLAFYNCGKTVSTYEQVEVESEDNPFWKINEVIPWLGVIPIKRKSYLVFNKVLEEMGSIAYKGDDGFWYPSPDVDGKSKVDFYSQLKGRFNYLETGDFFSMQGINISKFSSVGNQNIYLSR